MNVPGSTRMTARLALGRALRDIRKASGVSGSETAGRLGWSQSKVSRIEAARVRSELADIEALLDLYRVQQRDRSALLALAAEAAGPASEWRNSSRVGLSRRQQDFVEFESAASSIRHYQPAMIPGPLQTRSYADRVLAIVSHPDPARAYDARVARRSAILRPGGPTVQVVLTELAIRWNPGPSGVLMEQLAFLADVVEDHRIDLRVIPFDREQYAFLAHPVVVYEFADSESPLALVETTTQDVRVTEADEVRRIDARVDALVRGALGRKSSVKFVRQVAGTTMERRRK